MRTPGSLGRRLAVAVVSAATLLSVVVPSQSAHAAVSASAADPEIGDPTSLPPLAGSAGSGPLLPVFGRAVVTPDNATSVSTQPTLRSGLQQTGTYVFDVAPLTATAKPKWRTWRTGRPDLSVPASAGLAHGHAYQWQVTSPDGKVHGPYGLLVDLAAVNRQDTERSTPVGVALASGFPRYTWTSHTMQTAAGEIGVGLDYSPVNDDSAELPHLGWRLVATSATGYESLQENPEGTVDLVSKNQGVVTYVDRGNGYLAPVDAIDGQPTATGTFGVLVHNADGTYTVTDTTRATVTFGVPNGSGRAWVTSESVSGREQIQRSYDPTSGRLTAITDPISDRSVTLEYGTDCPEYEGFAAAPEGMLCRVDFWDGSSTGFAYVSTPAGVQLGRAVDYEGSGQPQVTDYGYDASGRLTAVRSPIAAVAVASPAAATTAGSDPNAPGLLTQVDYDPTGRVAAVTAPAPTIGADRNRFTYSYTSDNRTLFAGSDGTQGAITYDPATFATLRSTNPRGTDTVTTYDKRTNPIKTVDASGKVTTTQYNDAGLVQQRNTPSGGQTRYEYDRTYNQNDPSDPGKAMRGLDVTYWPNARWSGLPGTDELGPTPAIGQPLPGSLDVDWTNSPIPGRSEWSARMVGRLQLPDPAQQGKNDTYAFRVTGTGTPSLWIDGVQCTARPCGSTGMSLAAGGHQIRVDLAVPAGSAGAVQVVVRRNDGSFRAVPMDWLHPDFNLTTGQSSLETPQKGDEHFISSRSSYKQPQIGLVGSTWNSAGLAVSTSYETVAGVGTRPIGMGRRESVPRQTGTTMPAGNQTGLAYWGDDEMAAADCPDQEAADQAGLLKTAAGPNPDTGGPTGVTSTTWYGEDGRVVAARTGAGPLNCRYYSDGGQLRKVQVLGDAGRSIEYSYVAGNPLVAQQVSRTTAADGTETVRTMTNRTDLLGRPVANVDGWGTKVATTYDVAGKPVMTVVTAPNGYTITKQFTYRNGLLVGTQVSDSRSNGKPIISATPRYDAAERMTAATYGNGLVLDQEYDPTGVPDELEWTDGDGVLWRSAHQLASSGRVLSASLSRGGDVSTFDYTYDEALRLSDVELDTDQPVRDTSWSYRYDLNSNRTAQRVDGQKTIDYAYDRADRLTRVGGDKDLSGTVGYDDLGNVTQVGELQMTYDTTGDVVSVRNTDTKSGFDYLRDGTGTVIGKTTITPSSTRTVHYSTGGLVLDDQNRPVVHTVQLPGGITVERDLTADPADPAAQTWLVPNVAGNTMFSTDAAGHSANPGPALYTPFGESLTSLPRSPQASAPLLGWQGRAGRQTEQTGEAVVLLGQRLYVPALGRFLQPDPQLGGSANDYDYANQDPVNSRDETGRAAWWQWLTTILVGAAITIATSGLLTAAAAGVVGAGLSSAAVTTGLSVVIGSVIGAAGSAAMYAATTPLMGGDFTWGGFAAAVAIGAVVSIYTAWAAMWQSGQTIIAQSYRLAAAQGRIGWMPVIRMAYWRSAAAAGEHVWERSMVEASSAGVTHQLTRKAFLSLMCTKAKSDMMYGPAVGLSAALKNSDDPRERHPVAAYSIQGSGLLLSSTLASCL